MVKIRIMIIIVLYVRQYLNWDVFGVTVKMIIVLIVTAAWTLHVHSGTNLCKKDTPYINAQSPHHKTNVHTYDLPKPNLRCIIATIYLHSSFPTGIKMEIKRNQNKLRNTMINNKYYIRKIHYLAYVTCGLKSNKTW